MKPDDTLKCYVDVYDDDTLRKKFKKVIETVDEFKRRSKINMDFAEKQDSLHHDSILSRGKSIAYSEAYNYLESILW